MWKHYELKKEFKNNKFNCFYNKEKKATVHSFGSIAELIECYEENFIAGKWINNAAHGEVPKINETQAQREKRMKREDKWQYGSRMTAGKTYERLVNGFATEEQLTKVAAEKDKIYSTYPQLNELEAVAILKKRRKKFSDDGYEIDIDRYLIGEPEQWIARSNVDGLKRTAKIQYDMPTSAANDPEAFMKNMTFLAAFIDIIEMGGISCELWVSASATNVVVDDLKEKYTSCEVCLKHAHESLDIQRLISAGNVGLFREYFFSTWDNITRSKGQRGLGQAIDQVKVNEIYGDYFEADILIKAADFWASRNVIEMSIKKLQQIYGIEAT